MNNCSGPKAQSESYSQALSRAAGHYRIQSSFYDIWGKHHTTSDDVKQAILQSLGVQIDSTEQLELAITQKSADQTTLIPATMVLPVDEPKVPLTLPAHEGNGEVSVLITFEDGQSANFAFQLDAITPSARLETATGTFSRFDLLLPKKLPLGYHTIDVQAGQQRGSANLILAPSQAWWPEATQSQPHNRYAGIAISLYGLRSRRNWGVGDFTDLEHFTGWMATHTSADFIALNPLHAIANRVPYNTSPYLPQCTFYRNFLYLDVERIADFRNSISAQRLVSSPKFQAHLAALRSAEFVDYEATSRLKLRFLKLLFRSFLKELRQGSARAAAFSEFTQKEGELLDRFATYCVLDEHFHKRDRNVWLFTEWPEPYRHPNTEAVRDFVASHWRSVVFYKYVQWQVDLQVGAAHKNAISSGMKIGLYHDLALATDRFGADLWAFPDFYISGCRVGSPPDDFSPSGQDWSFPPPNSENHRRNGYQLFRRAIANNARHGGALRMDHVMRFFRLYWIPDGKNATEGTYVEDFAEDLLGILALESVRNHFILVGEDLGTVEPYVREALEKYRILSYRLLYFEKKEGGHFKLPNEYPMQALVSSTTHDLPTLAGFWTNRDIESRLAAGILHDEQGYQSQIAARANEKQKMLDVFHYLNLLPESYPRDAATLPEFTGELHNAAVGFLASTPSSLFVLNQEDLTKETEQQNLPGSTHQYPNWCRKMRYTVEELYTSPDLSGFCAMFESWLNKNGRANR